MIKKVLYYYDRINDLRVNVLFLYLTTVLMYTSSRIEFYKSLEISFVVFLSASFAYIYNRYTDYDYDLYVDSKNTKFTNKKTYLLISFSFLLLSFSMSALDSRYLYLAFFGAAAGFLYSTKTLFDLPVKNYLLCKNIFAAGSKGIIMYLIFKLFTSLSDYKILLLSLSAFIIHFCYEMMWDIRDIESDKIGNVKTFANKYGKDFSLTLASAIAILGIYFNFYFFESNNERIIYTYLILLFFIMNIYFSKKNNPRLYHLYIYINIFLKSVYFVPVFNHYIARVII